MNRDGDIEWGFDESSGERGEWGRDGRSKAAKS
jgi:hypothetical protein